MRKFKITLDGKIQTIFADTKEFALKYAKVNVGYDENVSICSHTEELFNGIEDLEMRCKAVLSTNPIEVVALWIPCIFSDERPRRASITILRTDGYTDSIYFEIGDTDKSREVYRTLSKYNREITPLEKFHASC